MAFTISASGSSGVTRSGRSLLTTPSCRLEAFHEGGHQLEKLEFALAVAETRGDQLRAAALRAQIEVLGGNIEEPGT
ncbi:MAG TPA: hypothetical protein ACN46Y_08050 [Prochlorococcus sp.]